MSSLAPPGLVHGPYHVRCADGPPVTFDDLAEALQEVAFAQAEGFTDLVITDCAGRSIPVPETEASS